ncbi:MAG: class I SAM-dependent methyltransferase [Bacteroidota bacterium]|nr:class I SAM-dependent methyltransferase [Bacteroidota bacterium]
MGRPFYYYDEVNKVMPLPFTEELISFFEQCGYTFEHGVWYAQPSDVDAKVETRYHSVRVHEGWIYPDAVVSRLPRVSRNDRHYHEWVIRQRSAEKLLQYLVKKYSNESILDVGCGNGWMAHKFADAGFSVCAVDLNHQELTQAARVFGETKNIQWLYGDLIQNILPVESFHIIILASSFQYFPNVHRILNMLLSLLIKNGEIHILDTPLYTDTEKEFAVERTKIYYSSIGYPESAHFYHHRTYNELKGYTVQFLYQPNQIMNKIKRIMNRRLSPFPWIKITKP